MSFFLSFCLSVFLSFLNFCFSSLLLQLLADSGFLYDSSIVESVKTEEKKAVRLWPYRMDAGIPQNRHRIKKGTEKDEKHPGVWEVPLWVLLNNGQRYCMGKYLHF